MLPTFIIVASFAGCSSSDDNPRATRSTTTSTATTTLKRGEEEALEEVTRRLRSAGYSPGNEPVSGKALASVVVSDVHIIAYRSAADANIDGASIKQVFRNEPGRGVVRVVGTRVYFIGRERRLLRSERVEFTRLVALAEGKR
jgi:hypothetical protein